MNNKLNNTVLYTGSALIVAIVFFATAPTCHSTNLRASVIQPAEISGEMPQAGQVARSRDIIESGLQVEVSGVLRKLEDDWYLVVENVMHELLTAREEFMNNLNLTLEEGKEVKVKGFFLVEEDERTGVILSNVLTMDGKDYRFREDDGTPLWRGSGGGGGRGSRPQ